MIEKMLKETKLQERDYSEKIIIEVMILKDGINELHGEEIWVLTP